MTNTLGAAFTATMTGKVAAAPAGDLRLDLALSRNATRTTARDRLIEASRSTAYANMSGQVGPTIPPVAPTSRLLGFLGSGEVGPASDHNAVDGVCGALGTNPTAN